MRLLITVGYQMLLLPKDCDYSAIIEAVSRAQIVEETGPYNQRVLVAKDGDVEVKLLNDGDIRLPDVTRAPDLEKLLEIAKERNELQSKVYELEQKLKRVETVIALVAPTPGA